MSDLIEKGKSVSQSQTVKLRGTDFLTSDLHVGKAVWPYRAWYKHTDSPTQAWQEAAGRIWDDQADQSSTILLLGDAVDLEAKVEEALDWYSRRPGTKILVPGNNDLVHPMNGRNLDTLKAQGWFDVFTVIDPGETYLQLESNELLPISHYPASESRQKSWLHPKAGMSHSMLHGHTHSQRKISMSDQGPDSVRQLNVGWMAWKRLVTVDQALEVLQLQAD